MSVGDIVLLSFQEFSMTFKKIPQFGRTLKSSAICIKGITKEIPFIPIYGHIYSNHGGPACQKFLLKTLFKLTYVVIHKNFTDLT